MTVKNYQKIWLKKNHTKKKIHVPKYSIFVEFNLGIMTGLCPLSLLGRIGPLSPPSHLSLLSIFSNSSHYYFVASKCIDRRCSSNYIRSSHSNFISLTVCCPPKQHRKLAGCHNMVKVNRKSNPRSTRNSSS